MCRIVMLAAVTLLAACGASDARDGGDAAGAAGTDAGAVTADGPSAPPGEALADASGDVAMMIAATVDGRRFAAEGVGECRHAPDAYIYGVPSTMWLVQYRGEDIQSLSLTLWRPHSGEAEMLSLTLSTADATSSISTVRGGEPAGSATARFESEGAGGRFVVDGRDEDGNDVALEVTCERFGSVEAVGG